MRVTPARVSPLLLTLACLIATLSCVDGSDPAPASAWWLGSECCFPITAPTSRS